MITMPSNLVRVYALLFHSGPNACTHACTHARAHTHNTHNTDELSVRAGHKLVLLGIAQPGWFVAHAATGGVCPAGLVPANYLQVLLSPTR